MHVGGDLHGEEHKVVRPMTGYRFVDVKDGPLSVSYAVHDSILDDEAPREIRRVIGHQHNQILRAQKQPMYASADAVTLVHRELMMVFMRAEFLGVDIAAGRESLLPRAMGNTYGWIEATAKTL